MSARVASVLMTLLILFVYLLVLTRGQLTEIPH
jgi:hypothetical protein